MMPTKGYVLFNNSRLVLQTKFEQLKTTKSTHLKSGDKVWIFRKKGGQVTKVTQRL